MMALDTLIAVGIVFVAAIYLYRKFAGTKKSAGCGCASGGGCCGTNDHSAEAHSCASKH
jgi:hypothetical protein